MYKHDKITKRKRTIVYMSTISLRHICLRHQKHVYIYVIQTYTCVWLQHNHVWVLTWACGFLSKQINAFQLRMACFFMPLATPNRATPKSCYPFQNISKKKEHNLKHRLKPSKEKHRPGGNLSTCNCTKLPKRPSFSKFGTPKLKFLSFSLNKLGWSGLHTYLQATGKTSQFH